MLRSLKLPTICLSLCVITGLFAQENKSLARVAILTFEDRTGTKNYGYLPSSLTEAIDKSLQRKFEYVREDPVKSDAARRNFHVRETFNAEQATNFARSNHFDIVIFGFFTLDAESKQVIVTTYVAFDSVEKFRVLRERKNKADATIFSLADKVADDIVGEMTAVANAQSGSEKPIAAVGKLELKKNSEMSWANKNWQLSLEAGPAAPLGGNNVKPGAGAALRIIRHVWAGLYSGAEVGFAFTSRTSTDTSSSCLGNICSPTAEGGNFSAGYATTALGYAFYPGERWRIFADAGPGIARGGFLEYNQTQKTDQTRFLLRAAFGVDFLISTSLALGIGARLHSFPSDSSSFPFFQPGVRVVYGF